MSIAQEIQRLQSAKADIKSAIEQKGVTVGDGTIDTYAEKIGEISGGGDNYYDTFWDNFQDYGNRVEYDRAFYKGWNDNTFAPKYDIQPTNAQEMFYGCQITDIKGICENRGITLDFSKATNTVSLFYTSAVTKVGTIDLSSAASGNQIFYKCTDLESVDLIVCLAKHTFNNTFANCGKLKEIRFSGEIGAKLTLAHSSLLSSDSVQSIIDHLADLTGGTAQTLTLHSTVGAKLTDEQKATITAKNWELVY